MVLYEGLIRIVTSDPVVADNVLDFLWPHFLNYYTEVKLPKRFLCSLLSTRFCRFSRVHSFSKTNKVVLMGYLLPEFLQGAECPLKMDSCFKVEDGKVCIVEPLDCLLSCVSSILRLQQNSNCPRPRDAYWKCFGFAPTQDNEVCSFLILKSLTKALNISYF